MQISMFEEENKAKKPLADRIRPETLDEYRGQEHLKPRITALLRSKRLPSVLLFGPPGCGKSTLAILLAKNSGRKWLRVSAPEAGLQKLRKQLAGVEVLVLDELHRFSKAQQDFFLPILESGEITLLASTTENPSFSVTRQLLSRMHVLKLEPLPTENMVELARRGTEAAGFTLDDEVYNAIAGVSHGDARTMLNLLEYVSQMPEEQRTIEHLRKSLPAILLRHDKNGDSHYELASALIKSIRGSDPDAALYYLACLLEGGEDPRFVTRRLIISASEDIGLADPQALPQAVACQQAVEFVGMPEGFIPMAQCVVYLALAPKSNSTYAAYKVAAQELRNNGQHPVPIHLRNAATALQKEWGYKKDYIYPHDYEDGWAPQQYLPDNIQGKRFYKQRTNGYEARIGNWLKELKKKS